MLAKHGFFLLILLGKFIKFQFNLKPLRFKFQSRIIMHQCPQLLP